MTAVFFVPKVGIVDDVADRGDVVIGLYSGKTADQLKREYPGLEIGIKKFVLAALSLAGVGGASHAG